ncbi:undecaprenyl-phosphate glucose phosphotransferase [Methylobacterium sp. Leaf466]|uniref:undecaprenyl-phosphate glucose phosphotransferase n=1 Tax=Methylobacterium sp. Leaf466 TaxID=1736386 RepID=UPI0006FF0040|nr:undecaprenyl-phosphate glucose phosphotransferase [Methylobacterium sp. Leaf466]KQT77322.1 undecaprenyl-phosphate glucose phosphotransferase [Methylobacterium sp. Leaf466]
MSAFDVRDLLKVAGAPGARVAGFDVPAAAPPAETTRPMAAAPLSPVVLTGTVRVLEFAAIVGLGVAVHLVQPDRIGPLGLRYLAAILGSAVLAVALIQVSGGYRIAAFRSVLKAAPRLFAAWSLAFLVVAAALVFAKIADQYSRIWLATFYGAGLVGVMAGRMVLARIVATQMRQGRFDRRTAIVGGGPLAENLIRALEAQADAGIRVVGFFDDRADDRAATVIAGYPKLGTVSDLVAYARSTRLDLVVFTLPIAAEERLMQMLTKLWVLPIDIRLSAQATRLKLRPRAYSYLGDVAVLDVFDKPIADWDIVVKGIFDRVVGVAMLVALAPVMIGVALAVRFTSPGPILFRQKRHGFNNEIIEVLKFRSMYVDQCDYAAAKQVTRGDPRVTPVGRFIRRTSLDELPQLFNVLKGELSLVGPRPHAINARTANTLYDQVVDGYFARHKVKPGITGWAQVKGWRGETDTDDKIQRRVEHDLYYIENWSVLFDIRIMLETPISLFTTRNAY